MRLPADATLIVVDAEAAGAPEAAANVASLVGAWRQEGLPVVRAREPDAGEGFPPQDAAKRGGEHEMALGGASAFAGAELERLLEEIGATTLVLCGSAAKVAESARDAAALGYQVYIVADACFGAEAARRLATLAPDCAALTDAASALAAASVAKFRQRWKAERSRSGR